MADEQGGGSTAIESVPESTTPPAGETYQEHQGSGSHTFQVTDTLASSDFSAIVPEEYRNEEWVQNNLKADNPADAFFKQFKEAQSKIGAKAGLLPPAADAPTEQWDAFYKGLNAPENVELYKPEPMQWSEETKQIGEYLDSSLDPGFMDAMAKEAQKVGIHPQQFKALVNGYKTNFIEVSKANLVAEQAKAAELDGEYTKYMESIFGIEAAKKQEFGNKILRESLSPMAKTVLQEMSETKEGTAALAVLSDFAAQIHAKYTGEDAVLSGSVQNPMGLDTGLSEVEAISKKCQELMTYDGWGNHRDPEYLRRKEEVDRLYARQKDLMTNPAAR